MNPQFPVYIISKGRWRTPLTAKHFERMGVPYRMVIEQQELEDYASVIDRKKLIVLDPSYRERYDAFMPLKPEESRGSGPARNFVWDHSVAEGAKRHWIVDDNIRGFRRMNNNRKIVVSDGTIFKCMEDFIERYRNIALAGPAYDFFCPWRHKIPPYILNTRIYSCILILNSLPFRWRGRYNEDVDLSLRALKAGWCTIEFNAFLQNKAATQSMTGGNTSEIYDPNAPKNEKGYSSTGTTAKSRMLYSMHPDCTRLLYRYGRAHHYVDYKPFQKSNKLVRRDDIEIRQGIDDYGMRLVRIDAGAQTETSDAARAARQDEPQQEAQARAES